MGVDGKEKYFVGVILFSKEQTDKRLTLYVQLISCDGKRGELNSIE